MCCSGTVVSHRFSCDWKAWIQNVVCIICIPLHILRAQPVNFNVWFYTHTQNVDILSHWKRLILVLLKVRIHPMCENMLFCTSLVNWRASFSLFLVVSAKQVDDEGVFSHVVSHCLSFSSSSSHSAVLALFRAQLTRFSYCQPFSLLHLSNFVTSSLYSLITYCLTSLLSHFSLFSPAHCVWIISLLSLPSLLTHPSVE